MKEGVNIVVHSFDVALFSQRLQHDINSIKKAAGDIPNADASASLVV
jgi:4-hydroxy-2-oxoheptanedioate aldolase